MVLSDVWHFTLKLAVDSHAEDTQRTSVGVEGGMRDELIITGHPEGFPDIYAVKQIQGRLGASVNKAIADKAIDTAKTEIPCVRLGDSAQIHSCPRDVFRTRPMRTLRQHSYGQ